MASQARVLAFEGHVSGGLRVMERHCDLLRALQSTDYLVRAAIWREWFAAAPCSIIVSSVQKLQAQRRGPAEAISALSQNTPRPWPRSLALAVRRGVQRWISGQLEEAPVGWVEERMRHKVERWKISGFPRRYVPRILSALGRLAGLVPPRVQVAVLSSLYNRWVTERRFQRHGGVCRFGCGGDDSIEHYLCCARLRDFGPRRLGLRLRAEERWEVMLLARDAAFHGCRDGALQRIALLHYVGYRGLNTLRHHPHLLRGGQGLDGLFQQCLVEGIRGHSLKLL